MKKLPLMLGLVLLVLAVPQALGYEQELYYTNSSSTSDFSTNGYINISADAGVGGNCSTEMIFYTDINTTSSYNYRFYAYIDGILNFTNEQSGSVQRNCLFLGNRTVTGGFHNATLRALSLGTARPVNLYLEMMTTCYTNDSYVYKTSNDYNTLGFNMYQDSITAGAESWAVPPAHCVARASGVKETPRSINRAWNPTEGNIWYVPFNSGTGNVEIQYYVYQTGTWTARGGYLDATTLASTQLFVVAGGSSYQNYSLSLIPDTEYVAWVRGTSNVLQGVALPVNVINITVLDYQPNYVCTNWTACITAVQSRTCTDTKGGSPDIEQTRVCLPENESIMLGFEEYYPEQAYNCIPNVFPLCSLLGYVLVNQSVYYPDLPRWTVFNPAPQQYYTTITSGEATQGSRSLKMWYIPPSPPDHPTFSGNATVCGNVTSGTYPLVTMYGINASFFASYNFTFPTELMALQFDVKKCAEQVVQFDGWCGRSCFSFNCTDSPIGDYIVSLYDQINGTNLFYYTGRAVDNWTTIDIDLNGKVTAGVNYTLNLAVSPLPINPYTAYGDCVYFDNVKIINRVTPIECTQEETCIGNDRYVQILENNICISKIYYNDSECIEAQVPVAGNQSIFTPISSIANAIVNTTTNQTLSQSLQAQGFGFTLLFLTPIFWIFMIIVAIMSVISYYTRHMEIGGVAGLLTLIAVTTIFPELLWVTVVIIVIAGYIIGRTVVRAVQGG